MNAPHRPRKHVSVLGAGSWGTALAALACPHNDTLLLARNPSIAAAIDSKHVNPGHLSEIALPAELRCTSDFQEAVEHARTATDGPGLIILGVPVAGLAERSEEHTSELQSLMRISYAVFCLK